MRECVKPPGAQAGGKCAAEVAAVGFVNTVCGCRLSDTLMVRPFPTDAKPRSLFSARGGRGSHFTGYCQYWLLVLRGF